MEHCDGEHDVVPDGSNPRQRIVEVEQEEEGRSVARRAVRSPPAEVVRPGRDLRWWLVQALCGEDQEAHQVLGAGGRAGRQLGVLVRHCQVPVILLLALLLTAIVPLSPENCLAILAAAVLASAAIIYQNICQVDGE